MSYHGWMWEEASVSNRWKHIYFHNASWEAPPDVVHRTHRSTGEELTKYHNSYLYCDIL